MLVSFKPGDDHAYIDGVAAMAGFKDLELAGISSVEFNFPAHTGVVKWSPVDDIEIVLEDIIENIDIIEMKPDGSKSVVGTQPLVSGKRKVQKKTGTQHTPADTPINYDQFYAFVSRDLNAWYALRAEIHNRLELERHSAESEAAMDDAEKENAAFDAAKKAIASQPAEAQPEDTESPDDKLKRIIAAHQEQAEKNTARVLEQRGKRADSGE